MRRPPDKDAPNLSERDVETSNATLNTLFGGARKKSWMIGAGAPVRPSPRTSTSRTVAQQVSWSQRNAATVLPSPAPSDEPSPVVPSSPGAGTTGGDDGRRAAGFAEARRPSVSIARGSTENTWPPDNSHESTRKETPPQNPPVPSKRPHPQPQRPTYPSEIVVMARPAMENPPLPSSVLLPPENYQSSSEVTSPTTWMHPQSQRQGNVFTRSQEEAPESSVDPAYRHPAQNTQWSHSRQMSRDELPTFRQATSFSSRLPSAPAVQETQSPSSSSAFTLNPHKRQRTQQATMPSLRPRTVLIDAHIASVGGFESLNYDLERPRFQLLERACINEDSFYVALHQLFCVWDFEPNNIVKIAGFPSMADLKVAFKNVSQLIRENDQLSINHKKWFAAFPSPLADLLRTSEPYRNTVADVGYFLGRLATEWVPLSMECSKRKYPPLVDELVRRLGLLSPILQGVVFTAARRNIDVTEGAFANRMEMIFKQDQMDHQALAIRYNTARPPTVREVQDRNDQLVLEYLKTYTQFLEQRFAPGSTQDNAPTPVVPSNGHLQHQLPSQHQQPPYRQANMPEPTGNWHQFSPPPPPQQQQHASVQQDSDVSSNINVVDRRTQSIASHQVHHSSSSPILLQGLTVSSPVQQAFQGRRNEAQTPQHAPPNYSSHQIPVTPNGTYPHGALQSINHTHVVQSMSPQQGPSGFSSYQPPATPNGIYPQGAVQSINPTQVAQSMSPQQYQHWVARQNPTQAQRQQQQQYIAMQQLEQMQRQQNQQSLQVLNHGPTSLDQPIPRRQNSGPNEVHRTNNISSGNRQIPTTGAVFGQPRQFGSVEGYRNEPQLSPEQTAQMVSANYNAIPALQRPLFPPLGYVQQSQPTNPELTALHQAHLRSPRLVAAITPSESSQGEFSHRFYQSVKAFALQPTNLNSSTPLAHFDFEIPASDFDRTPNDYLRGPGQIATREFRNGTIQYRLRCVQMKKTEITCPTSQWVVRDTVWPESACLDINTNHLEIRRKSHHGKDLPIDVTSFVHAAGPSSRNRITLSITRGRSRMKEVNYFIAVEIIEILGHAAILEMCQQSHIPANLTLESIKKSLAGPESGDDDDFAMVVSDLAIDLADPFTARIFETPVRGSSCLHRECFDLQTFLLTRNSKPKRPEQPCMIDVWKCPLCSKDARPYSLRIDDFFASVRASLESQDLLDVKAIWIRPDGKWRPKVEERTGISDPYDSDDYSDDEVARKQKVIRELNQPSRSKKVVEVIDLDDD